MFLQVTKIQLKLYEEELINLIGKCNTITEFCSTPILCEGFNLSKEDEKELSNIIATLQNISSKLEDIKSEIQSIKFS